VARIALVLAFAAMAAAGLPSPGLYLAIGLGISAIGCGIVGYARRNLPGGWRLASAAAITVGFLGLVLGTARVVVTLAAIDRIDRLIP
jgi:hypothetical protein